MALKSYKDWAEGFTIFAKYETPEGALVAADHEIIYAGPNIEGMADEDVKRLEELGWDYDEKFECFYHFT